MDVRVTALVFENPDVVGRCGFLIPEPPHKVVVAQPFERRADMLRPTVGASRPASRSSARILRKLGAQRSAEAGATEHQLMALFGWTNPQQAAVYTKNANRSKLEAQAARLLQAQSSNKRVPLFAAVESSGNTQAKKCLIIEVACSGWRPLPDSNRCCRRERARKQTAVDNCGRRK
jgi:hypothetical protein